MRRRSGVICCSGVLFLRLKVMCERGDVTKRVLFNNIMVNKLLLTQEELHPIGDVPEDPSYQDCLRGVASTSG